MATYKEFAQKIKEKYPDYAEVDDMTLAKKMIEKYPDYADQVTFDTTMAKIESIPKEETLLGKINKTLLEEPAGDILFPRLSNSQGRPIQELTKDLLSIPGRTAYGLGAAGVDFGKGLFNYEGRVPEASEKLINEMKDYAGQGIFEGITKDPVTGALLPVSFGNLTMKAPQILGRMGYTGAVTLADRKMTANEEDRNLTPSDYAWSAGTAILPEALRGLGKYFAKPLSRAEDIAVKQVKKAASIFEEESPTAAKEYIAGVVKEAAENIQPPTLIKKVGERLSQVSPIGQVVGVGVGGIPGAVIFGASSPAAWKLAAKAGQQVSKVAEAPRYLETYASNKNKTSVKQDDKLLSDLYKVKNDLTETEIVEYKKPENREKFYKRFPNL